MRSKKDDHPIPILTRVRNVGTTPLGRKGQRLCQAAKIGERARPLPREEMRNA